MEVGWATTHCTVTVKLNRTTPPGLSLITPAFCPNPLIGVHENVRWVEPPLVAVLPWQSGMNPTVSAVRFEPEIVKTFALFKLAVRGETLVTTGAPFTWIVFAAVELAAPFWSKVVQ
jgi:hypothetical protein